HGPRHALPSFPTRRSSDLDGLHAALVKRYGPNVRSEIGIDELKGTIRVVVLRTVVETVEDPGSQVALEEARFEDADFQVGDVEVDRKSTRLNSSHVATSYA